MAQVSADSLTAVGLLGLYALALGVAARLSKRTEEAP